MSWRYRRHKQERTDDDDEYRFGDLFDFDFGLGFREIDELIDSMFKTVVAKAGDESAVGPVYYGYSVTVGPDGKPHVREFGNVKPTRNGTLELGAREPFVDTVLNDKENSLKIIAEMPGIQKEDIQLELLQDSITIKAERGERKYETSVPLNVPVDASTATATYNNGVLEIKAKLKSSQRPKGVSVRVE